MHSVEAEILPAAQPGNDQMLFRFGRRRLLAAPFPRDITPACPAPAGRQRFRKREAGSRASPAPLRWRSPRRLPLPPASSRCRSLPAQHKYDRQRSAETARPSQNSRALNTACAYPRASVCATNVSRAPSSASSRAVGLPRRPGHTTMHTSVMPARTASRTTRLSTERSMPCWSNRVCMGRLRWSLTRRGNYGLSDLHVDHSSG